MRDRAQQGAVNTAPREDAVLDAFKLLPRPFVVAVLAVLAAPAIAAQRTFVGSDGADTNPCTRQLPCRGFAAAILLTDPSGEIIVLDSAGYGTVTISKAVSIIAPSGVYAGISVFAAQDGVTVTAGATDKVSLRGLSINGQGGNNGIVVTAAQQVHIERCEIANLLADGIKVGGGGAVYVANSTVRANGAHGILVTGTAGEVFVDDTRVAHNVSQGILAEAGRLSVNRSVMEHNGSSGLLVNPATAATVTAVVRGSVAVGNAGTGIVAITDAAGEVAYLAADDSGAMRNGFSGFAANSNSLGTVALVLNQALATDNAGSGMFASGSNTTVSISASALSRNGGNGMSQNAASLVRSHQNNAVSGNVFPDTFGLITNVGTL